MTGSKCGLSWSGFNLSGDRKSIDEVKRMMHSESYLKQCDTILRKQIKVLEQALSFAHDVERQLRERIEALETKLKFNSAHYPEGFRWDIDDYPTRQTRRWNSDTKQLEDGKDPPFVAPAAVPFEEGT